MANQEYERWLAQPLPGELRNELLSIRGDEAAIYDRFYTDLAFGTGGLRGVLGAGTNRMNEYTVGRASQGFADYLNEHFESPAVAIAYDSRHMSEKFARRAASVFAGNGIKAYLFPHLAPTPVLSFAVRRLGCDAGVVVTASHNPPQYNGYKAYNSEGCQLSGEACEEVYAKILAVDLFEEVFCQEWEDGIETGMIELLGESIEEAYLDEVTALLPKPGRIAESGLKMVYTPLNGAGGGFFLKAAGRLGIGNLEVVAEQRMPDGDFSTCTYPNPEMPEALELALELARETGAELVLATDPDADRVGCAVKDGGDYALLTGNQVGFLLTDYLARARREAGTLAADPVLLKSLVSSPVADRVAAEQGVEVIDLLPGFKYIGEKMTELEKAGRPDRFLLGFEESCGYLAGGYARDKDGVAGALLIAEMAAYYKEQGRTLAQGLEDLYARCGYCLDRVESVAFPGAEGMQAMAALMERLRQAPPRRLGERAVTRFADYQRQTVLEDGRERKTGLPPSNILLLRLEGGERVIVRPSGTEPKLKVYFSVFEKDREAAAEKFKKLRELVFGWLGL